jgi:hypothetical protein
VTEKPHSLKVDMNATAHRRTSGPRFVRPRAKGFNWTSRSAVRGMSDRGSIRDLKEQGKSLTYRRRVNGA